MSKKRENVCVRERRGTGYPFPSQYPFGGVNLIDTLKLAGLVKATASPPVTTHTTYRAPEGKGWGQGGDERVIERR